MSEREIKFRAFVKEEMDYYFFDKGDENEIKFSDGSFIVMVESQEWESGSGEWVDSYSWREIEGKIVLEQYTGLKDKNGIDIYEGDIIQWILTDDVIIFKVEWSQEDCSYVCFRDQPLSSGSMNQMYLDHFEIIGNIHENPELMEKK